MSRIDDMLIMEMRGEGNLWDAKMKLENHFRPQIIEFCKKHGIKRCRIAIDVDETTEDKPDDGSEPVIYWS